jgi:hypothetical protein
MAQQYLHLYEGLQVRNSMQDGSVSNYSPASGWRSRTPELHGHHGSGDVPA